MGEFRISTHVREKLETREIPEDVFDMVLNAPEQVVPASEGNLAFQSRVMIEGRLILLRIIVDPYTDPPTAATAYLTSRISRYWSNE